VAVINGPEEAEGITGRDGNEREREREREREMQGEGDEGAAREWR